MDEDGSAGAMRVHPAAVLIEGTHVAKRYGGYTALADVTFSVAPGITGLLGANGSGKTTLMSIVLGLQRANGGSLRVLGHDPTTAGAAVRERIGYSPEHHTLPGDVAANDFVRHVAELHGLPKEDAATRASDALWLVGLGEERFRPMGTMSTGQRQRVKLAQAIAHDPVLILLDEPTDGLDPVQRADMLRLIRRVADEYGISVLLSSHLLDEVEQVCDAVIVIGDGRVIAQGDLETLRGSQNDLVIELEQDDGITALCDALAAAGVAFDVRGRSVTVFGVDDSVFDVARDACIASHASIYRWGRRRISLEEVMLGTAT